MKILHLYDNLMNLYGDYANLTELKKLLEHNGEQVEIERRRPGDAVDFGAYGFVYIGSGTERNLRVALEDMRRLKDGFAAYVESGRPALLTGNSFEMLGKQLCDSSGREVRGLGLFDFETTEQSQTRLVGDVIYECGFLDSPVVGFVNKCSEIAGIKEPMFTVKMGLGDREGVSVEGLRRKNLFCTHLTGPALVKNPQLLCYIAELLLGRTPDDGRLEYEKKGYEVTLSELTKRMQNASA